MKTIVTVKVPITRNVDSTRMIYEVHSLEYRGWTRREDIESDVGRRWSVAGIEITMREEPLVRNVREED